MCFIYISVMATNTNSYEFKCWNIKTAFEFILLYEIATKSLISHRFIYSASNDTKQWLSNKYPGKDTVNKPPLCPLRPRDKRRKPEAEK